MEKKVSVIIPCHNAERWLPKCFVSLVEQSMGMEDMELIFVNDASTDDGRTWSMLCEFERAYPDSVIIIDLPENRRQGGARNEGLKYASGEYLSFVDADDWVEPEIYVRAYGRAKETKADIVQFNHNFYFEQAGIIPNQTEMQDECIIIKNDSDRKKMLMTEKITYGCWNKLYKRELVECAKVQYAEHVIYEEPLFVYPLLFYGACYVTIPDRLYVYRQNNSGTMRKDMKAYDTLLQHAQVQLATWNFMKQTPYFQRFYEEIKLYFLHTYFYETLFFAKQRGMEVTMELYQKLADAALREVPEMDDSVYSGMIPKQIQLYQLTKQGMTEKMLKEYTESL